MRFSLGTIYTDPIKGHKIACLDATNREHILDLMQGEKAKLAIHDPPYNIDINKEFKRIPLDLYLDFCNKWVDNTIEVLDDNSSLYVWMGADIRNELEPFVDFVILMRKKNDLKLRNYITVRNQRGYGTQKNWMSVRQELLYYVKGNPEFHVEAEYTDIPKKTKGYYKIVKGKLTENFERSKSNTIRAGNVWYDIQQVFYKLEENVEGCYAQKPLKAIKRIIEASSRECDLVIDFFGHSGTILIQSEISNRRCYIIDINPLYCELMFKRLEHYRKTGKKGWGNKKVIHDGKLLL